jgi:hypothetical protein
VKTFVKYIWDVEPLKKDTKVSRSLFQTYQTGHPRAKEAELVFGPYVLRNKVQRFKARTANHSRRHLLISDKSRFIAAAKYHKELINIYYRTFKFLEL